MTPNELKAARERIELKQLEFACLFNTTQQRISEWERGKRRVSPYVAKAITFFLDLPEEKQHDAKKKARAQARTLKKRYNKARHERTQRQQQQ
jgi:transcriptional regulator with XRE-family HTH domain